MLPNSTLGWLYISVIDLWNGKTAVNMRSIRITFFGWLDGYYVRWLMVFKPSCWDPLCCASFLSMLIGIRHIYPRNPLRSLKKPQKFIRYVHVAGSLRHLPTRYPVRLHSRELSKHKSRKIRYVLLSAPPPRPFHIVFK